MNAQSAFINHSNIFSMIRHIILLTWVAFLGINPSIAQPKLNQGLYAPDPPSDHAFVRIFNGNHQATLNIIFKPGSRTISINPGTVSSYFSIPATQQNLSATIAGRNKISIPVSLKDGLFYTGLVAENSYVKLIEDKKNSNKLKSLLSLYHFGPNTHAIDLLTADGKAKVFGNIGPRESASKQVNPVAIDLAILNSSNAMQLAQTSASMEPGKNYSLFAFRPATGDWQLTFSPNATEQH